ncbi:25S rRNA (uridine(2843)-N(3))-methyltransferase [Rhodotorula toruloides]|uniref:Uncharacterized protein n=1 Tax=Rhodotorula toruloides TaxID=5286 RepID=A0A0K3CG40_RHOTO|nr:25S rRNA (uridine(2843)-N(3))-methyltransferase [Rhodotorula toruloides]PRQ74423.1 Protein of unknown function (DUF3115)-domain containing protein [Rhodotorula toruloides]
MPQLNTVFSQLAVNDRATPSNGRATGAKSTARPRTNASAPSDLSTTCARLLTLLSRLFDPVRRSPTFTPTLQHVKGLLYNKEYLAAFGTESEKGERWREVYAARWVPARTVVYERIFEELGAAELLGWRTKGKGRERTEEEEEELEREVARLRRRLKQEGKTADEIAAVVQAHQARMSPPQLSSDVPDEVNVVMIGAGAGSEVVALGGVLGAAAAYAEQRRPRVRVQAVDQGSWGVLLDKMRNGLREEWPELASTDAGFDVDFVQGDILATAHWTTSSPKIDTPSQSSLLVDFSSPTLRLVTICFTISELLLQSRISTLRLLSHISQSAPSGTQLLIVESASLALIPLGKEGRTYPLGQLLDHALCGGEGKSGAWRIVKSDDAKWYRMPEGAEEVYNEGKGAHVKLENSRVVLRLYEKR